MSTVVTGTSTSFWDRVINTPPLPPNAPGATIEIRDEAPNEAVVNLFHRLTMAHKEADPVVLEFLKSLPKQAFDFDAHVGANTKAMIDMGVEVTAITTSRENFKELLAINGPAQNFFIGFQESLPKIEFYGDNFDLVVSIDTLPYVAPKDLQSTMSKIHGCLKDGGTLIGTIFATPTSENPVKDPRVEAVNSLGAYVYEGNTFTCDLLVESGFSLKTLETEGILHRFTATKISSADSKQVPVPLSTG